MFGMQGRTVLWGWMQELNRRVGDYPYAGCISLPRLLWLHPGSSISEPSEFGTHQKQDQRQHQDQRQQHGQQQQQEEGSEQFCSDTCGKPCTAGFATQLAFDLPHSSQDPPGSSHAVMENAVHMLHADDNISSKAGAPETAALAPGLPFLFQEPLPELVKLRRLEGAWLVNGDESLSSSSSWCSSSSNTTSHADSDLLGQMLSQRSSNTRSSPSRSSNTQSYSSGKPHQQIYPAITALPEAGSQTQHNPAPPHTRIPRSGRFPIPCISGPYLDLELVLLPDRPLTNTNTSSEPASADSTVRGSSDVAGTGPPVVTGLVMHCWQCVAHEECATLLYHWDTGVLEVVWEALADHRAAAHSYCSAVPCRQHPCLRRVGGKLQRPPLPGRPLHLRVLLDYSLLEVYTGGGEVLSTRVYRGSGEAGSGCGLEIVSYGGDTLLLEGTAGYEMGTIWQGRMDAGSVAGMEREGLSRTGSDVSETLSCRSFRSSPGV